MRAALLIVALVPAVLAQEGPATLADATAALTKALADDALADAQTTLATMPALYPKAKDEKEQKAAIAAVGKAARAKDLRVRHGAFAVLGAARAKGSSKHLGRWLKPPKRFKGEIPPSYAEAIRAAGEIADVSTLSTLLKLADHNDLPIAEVATLALGGYHTLPTKRRKNLAFDLVDRLTRLSARQRRKASAEVYARKATLGGATGQALQRLTGQKYETAAGWQRWKERAERQKNPFG